MRHTPAELQLFLLLFHEIKGDIYSDDHMYQPGHYFSEMVIVCGIVVCKMTRSKVKTFALIGEQYIRIYSLSMQIKAYWNEIISLIIFVYQ